MKSLSVKQKKRYIHNICIHKKEANLRVDALSWNKITYLNNQNTEIGITRFYFIIIRLKSTWNITCAT